jgi:hypothetical protein
VVEGMTDEHVHELLLDLAYGELSEGRAAEVADHLASCEACRKERDRLQRTRELVAPLRALEEPGPSFDQRIVDAARAEAGLQADGTPGPTIEVSGSVKPLGLQAARVDPLSRDVRVARTGPSRRAVWFKRGIVGASIAAGAGVALIVATSVQQKAQLRSAEVSALKIRAPEVPPEPSSDIARQPRQAAARGSGGDLAKETGSASRPATASDASAERERGLAQAAPSQEPGTAALPKREPKSTAPAAPAKVPPAEVPAQTSPPSASRDQLALKKRSAGDRYSAGPGTASKPELKTIDEKAAVGAAAKDVSPPPGGVTARRKAEPKAAEERSLGTSPTAGGAVGGTVSAPAAGVPAMVPTRRPADDKPAATALRSASGKVSPADTDPDHLEQLAGNARRSGSYPRASELYRLAAGLRGSKGDASHAAWDLAHAVECLAAASRLDEAGTVRTELLRSYPSEDGPRRAADRALGWPSGADSPR